MPEDNSAESSESPAQQDSDADKKPPKKSKQQSKKTKQKKLTLRGFLTSYFKSVAGVVLGGLVLGSALSVTAHMVPEDWISDSLEDYQREHNLTVPVSEAVDTQNIRVYDTSNPLAYFHMPGQIFLNVAGVVQEYPSVSDLNGDGEAAGWEKTVMTVGFGGYRFADALLTNVSTGIAHMFGEAAMGAYALPPVATGATPYIMPPLDMDAREYINESTSVPKKYVRDFDVTPEEIKTYIMLHEAKHTDFYGEAGADLHALQVLRAEEGGDDVARLVMASRALAPFSQQFMSFLGMEDTEHATAYTLDAAFNPVAGRSQSSYDAQRGAGRLADYVSDYMDAQDYEAEHYSARVYLARHDIIEDPAVQNDIFVLRQAELYIEALEYLAPDMPTVKNMIEEKQQRLQAPVSPQPMPGFS